MLRHLIKFRRIQRIDKDGSSWFLITESVTRDTVLLHFRTLIQFS